MARGKTTKKKSKGRKTPRQKTRKQLVEQLDKIFSQYIRLRDANEKGICKCITCNTRAPWHEGRKMQCGHFMSRGKWATRWEERNANAQCNRCNIFMAGRQYEHGQAIDEKYGEGTAEELLILSNQKGPNIEEIKELIELFSNKLKQLQDVQ